MMNRPIWNSRIAGLLLRVPLGFYFFFAGQMKLKNIEDFVETVRQFGILPDYLATLYGAVLPYAEIAAGALLILGIWTTLAAILAALLLISFSAVFAVGLFPQNPFVMNKDIILLGGALALLSTGAGALSIDRFRQTG